MSRKDAILSGLILFAMLIAASYWVHVLSRDAAENEAKAAEYQAHLAEIRTQAVAARDRGDAHFKLGEFKLAIEAYDEAGARFAQFAAQWPSLDAKIDLGNIYQRLGDACLQAAVPDRAKANFSSACNVRRGLTEAAPDNAVYRFDLARSLHGLGDASLQLGELSKAFEHYEAALRQRQNLAERDPNNAAASRDILVSYHSLGDLSLVFERVSEGLDFYEQAMPIAERLAADPLNTVARRDLAISHQKVGDGLLHLKRTDEALAKYTAACEINRLVAEGEPANVPAQCDLFVDYCKLAEAERARFEHAKAAAWYEKGHALMLPWHEKKLLTGQFVHAVRISLRELAKCRDAEKAAASFDYTFSGTPEQIADRADARLGTLLHRKQFADATATAERYAAWAEEPSKDREERRYDAACLYARCSAANGKEQIILLDKALALLEKAKSGGYFTEEHAARFRIDKDFDGVRKVPAFAKFEASLPMPGAAAPTPKTGPGP